MCGIFGAICQDSINPETVLNSITHRGPDSQGYYIYENLFLGHTRLSIQDLSDKASQPMVSKNGNFVIIFNGEIYNHTELRTQFLNDFSFRTTGDTETLLEAFVKYGESIFKYLNGIFAFAILDIQKKEIVIARDHFGVKPLYIYNDGRQFLFGSEIKSFIGFDIDKSINYKAMINYLTFLWSPGELTAFQNIKKVLPGKFVRINMENLLCISEHEYHNFAPRGEYLKLSEDQIIDKLDGLLTRAVERQLLSDVPVGFFLSGGLDSTLLVAIAKKLRPKERFNCFTINTNAWPSSADGFSDDLYYAKKAATILDVNLLIVNAGVDIVNDFDSMIWHLDEPQADPAPLNVLNIAKSARENNIKVLIGGTAGDDIFSGYRRHQALKYEKFIERIPFWIRRIIKYIVSFLPIKYPFFRRIKKLVANIEGNQIDRLIGYFDWIEINSVKKLFNNIIEPTINHYNPHDYFEELLSKTFREDDLLTKMLFLEKKTFLVDHNLNYTDKMTMAVGVEARVPYLDLDLVEFASQIPSSFKLKGNVTKYILKKLAERYLPKEIIYRPKAGFGAPVRKWITDDMEQFVKQRLSKERIEKMGIFNYAEVEKLVENNKAGKIDVSYTIWALLSIDSWMNQFVNRD